jgi:GntR family transcriptional regulator, transcriptional repressor for pyruvate dehydrogenase complex
MTMVAKTALPPAAAKSRPRLLRARLTGAGGAGGAGVMPVAHAVPVLTTETLADRLAARLAAQIQSGQLAPADRLPTEAQLAAGHGVSRSVVRESVHRLKSLGLVTSRQGSGVFVAKPKSGKALEFDAAVLDSTAAVVQVAEVRRALEIEMASLAAARAKRGQVAALKRSLVAIDVATAQGRDGVAEDLAFHRAIADATGNPQFSLLLAFLEQYLRQGMQISRGAPDRMAELMDVVRQEHHNIVQAIAAHDVPAARKAATLHLMKSEWRLQHGGLPRLRKGPP